MDKAVKDFKNLPLREGVGIVLLNKDNKVFVAKELIIRITIGKCHKVEWIQEKLIMRLL